jgi:predicted amidophosphoribosyltransferase
MSAAFILCPRARCRRSRPATWRGLRRACRATDGRPFARLALAPGHAADGRAAFSYDGAVTRAIVRLKDERKPDLARPLGDWLWRSLEPRREALRGSVVIPSRFTRAGWPHAGSINPCLGLKRVARGLRAPLSPLALRRLCDTPRQACARSASAGGQRGERIRSPSRRAYAQAARSPRR